MRIKALLTGFAVLALVSTANAATVWSGPTTTFFKDNTTNDADFLTANVSLTRGAAQFLFNPSAGEVFSSPTSPADTEWAFAGFGGNPNDGSFKASNFAQLNFDPFVTALGGPVGNGGPGIFNVIVGTPGVLHLISDDIYLDITFSQWGIGGFNGNAAVEYARATVPIPAALPLLGSALGLLAYRRRRQAAA